MRSLLDLDLPPLADAERRLAELTRRRRSYLLGTLGLAVLAGAAALLAPSFGLALSAGAAAAALAAAAIVCRRHMLLEGLRQVRSAYAIEPVSRAGARFASPARRRRLAHWLRKLVRAAEGTEYRAAYTAAAIEERVLARKQRLLLLAAALEGGESEFHPAGVAIVHCLLTRPGLSPLYNPGLGEDVLDDALHRVEACMDRAA